MHLHTLFAATAALGVAALPWANALPHSGSMSAQQTLPFARATNDSSSNGGNDDGVILPSFDTTNCPGYRAAGPVETSDAGFTLPLQLAGPACNAYGVDIANLTLAVVYEKPHQLHVHIYDTAQQQYQLPTSGLLSDRPGSDPKNQTDAATAATSHLEFHHTAENGTGDEAWAFWITRKNASADAAPLFDTRPANIPTYADPLNATTSSNRNTTAMPQHNLVFENQYVQLSSALPRDANVYGLGERYSSASSQGEIGETGWRLNSSEMLQPFFTLDTGDPVNSNMYGYHPVYLEVRADDERDVIQSHVVYHQNTAGLDVIMRPEVIQYRAIGGTLDFRIFSGDDDDSGENAPQTAMEQYVQFVNLPLMVPDWSFGFHMLRWGYTNTQDMRDVTQAMRAADCPLEVQWSDIDYLQSFRDFTVDPQRYSDLPAYVDELNEAHQHWIPIIDGAIPAAPQNSSDVYAPGTRGTELDVFLKNSNGSVYVGQVWPGDTFFADNHAPNVEQWWNEAYANLSSLVKYSGIWQDMQEPSSFIVGSAGNPNNLTAGNAHVASTSVVGWPEGYNNATSGNSGNITVDGTPTYTGEDIFYLTEQAAPAAMAKRQEDGAMDNSTDFHYSPADHRYVNATQRFLWDPPYAMHNGLDSSGPLVDNLNKKTVAMDTVSHAGKFYDLHNIDGSLLMKHTHTALAQINPGERPFIVGRSTYPGVGKYASHWLGDNYSKWSYMSLQVQGVLQFQLFGIPTVGADTCGFNGNTDAELCDRWMMMSAFMPFFRNHNTEGAIAQEPYRWDNVLNASRTAIYKRYEWLPELYTARARASQRGTPMAKSVWMEFRSAKQFAALRSTDDQYMLGENLLVSPVLRPNATEVTNALIPSANGTWRNIFTYDPLRNVTYDTANVTLDAPLSTINVHMRPGRTALTYVQPRYTIYETTQEPYRLIVNLDDSASANGTAYVDDGKSALPTPSRELVFAARDGTLNGTSTGDFAVPNKLQELLLLGVEQMPASLRTNDGRDLLASAQFDEARSLLNVTDVQVDLNSDWSIQWS